MLILTMVEEDGTDSVVVEDDDSMIVEVLLSDVGVEIVLAVVLAIAVV